MCCLLRGITLASWRSLVKVWPFFSYSIQSFLVQNHNLSSSDIYVLNFNLSSVSVTDILPTEYGGTNGCLDDLTKFWKAEVEASQEWLKLQVQQMS